MLLAMILPEDAVSVSSRAHHLLAHKSVLAGRIGDVELDRARLLLAVLLDKLVQALLSTTHGDDLGALLDEFVGHGSPNAGCGAHQKHPLVLERHRVARFEEVLYCG